MISIIKGTKDVESRVPTLSSRSIINHDTSTATMVICGQIRTWILDRWMGSSHGCGRNPKRNPKEKRGFSPIYSPPSELLPSPILFFSSVFWFRLFRPSNEVSFSFVFFLSFIFFDFLFGFVVVLFILVFFLIVILFSSV